MAFLSEIPVVGKIIDKISEVIVEAGIRGLRYTLCSKTLVNQLNSDIDDVKIQEGLLSRKVGIARKDGKIIEKHVEEWQEKVQSKKTIADELSRQPTSYTCFNVLPFPNPVSRFRQGRKAAHLSKDVSDLTASGMKLVANEVGYLLPVDNLPTSNSTYQNFASREEAYGKLWEALVDHNGDPILAIYGMPGVGKTLMVEKACKDAKDQKIFQKVARVNVSGEKLNVIKLQDKLAASLECRLESKDDEQQRASQLENSLKNWGKTLVLLDDVWEIIPLDKVGIRFGDSSSKGCKILLTSRKRDVCLDNNCKYPIEIKTLTAGEAWVMFQNAVGSSKIETLTDASLAEKVCKKCAALPLVINAVASALKNVPQSLWSQSLHQLESHRFEEIRGINGQVYACLAFSFKRLNVMQRRCLFLCSFFQEDEAIEIDMLFNLATGSQVLVDRRDINAVIDILRLSSLLLRGDDDTVKLHDIIREVARSEARGDPEYAFLSVRCNSWFPNNNNNFHTPTPRLLQLELEEDDVCCPNTSEFPDVRTLWLRGNSGRKQLSTDFLERFRNVEFLVLEGMSFPDQQPKSIHRLERLRAVMLNDCHIPQAFVSSISKNLETLCIWRCDLPDILELPELKYLRKLELVYNSKTSMEGKVISGLSRLEEVTILGTFTIRDDDNEAISIFWKLNQLTKLKNLFIQLPYRNHTYPGEDLVNNLEEFHIFVGEMDGVGSRSSVLDSSKKLILLDDGELEDGWMAVVEKAEVVRLDGVRDFADGFSNRRNMRTGAFADLKGLRIANCRDVKHVASWDGRNEQLRSSFSNLTTINISECRRLKYLFSAAVAKCLHQLQKLNVEYCDEIEEIIRDEGGRTDERQIITFPKLKELYLKELPKLTSFSGDKVRFPNMEKMTMKHLGSYVSIQEIELGREDSPPKLNTLKIHLYYGKVAVLPSQWLSQLENIEILVLKSFSWTGDSVFNGTPTFGRLREVKIERCEDTSLLRCSSLAFLQQLEKLKVSNCPLLEEILWGDEPRGSTNNTTISLPRLQDLQLLGLPMLKRCGIFACKMPAIESVLVRSCGFSTLFTSSAVAKCLYQLQKLSVKYCEEIEEIIRDEGGRTDERQIISFPKLKKLRLYKLPKFTSFSRDKVIRFPNMENMTMKDLGSYLSMQEIELGRKDSPPKLTLKINLSDQKVAELPSQWLFQLENTEVLELKCFSWTGESVFNGTPTFGRLRKVKIERCEDTSLLRCSSLAFLQQLETLKVSKCPLLEEILWGDERRGSTDNTTISLPRLRKLYLLELPMLKRCGIFACNMPAIESVVVVSCGFSSLFTSSAFTSLHRLSFLGVGGCPLLKNIVENEMHDETTKKTISLSCLTHIILRSLSSLESFSSSSIYALNMPALQEVTVDNCPLMHTFSLSEVIVPLVYFKSSIDQDPGTRISDLNKFVREGYGIEEECKASDEIVTKSKGQEEEQAED